MWETENGGGGINGMLITEVKVMGILVAIVTIKIV
jgi:hypothetical protein